MLKLSLFVRPNTPKTLTKPHNVRGWLGIQAHLINELPSIPRKLKKYEKRFNKKSKKGNGYLFRDNGSKKQRLLH